jgi:hypothetical protein
MIATNECTAMIARNAIIARIVKMPSPGYSSLSPRPSACKVFPNPAFQNYGNSGNFGIADNSAVLDFAQFLIVD